MQRSIVKRQSGFSLIETVIAIGLMGILAVGFLGALSNASKNLAFTDERQKAKTLAEHQMEYIKQQPFLISYTPGPISSEYSGYSVTIYADNVTSRDANMQKIRIIVSHQSKQILMVGNSTLEDYRVN